MLIGSYSIQIWWGLCGMTKFYRSCAAFEHRGKREHVANASIKNFDITTQMILHHVFVPYTVDTSLPQASSFIKHSRKQADHD